MALNQEDEGKEEDGALQIVLTAPLYFQSFQEYKRKELFIDLSIKCDDKTYAAHSLVVAAASPPIFKLLRSNPGQGCVSARCSDDEKAPDSSLPGSQKNLHQKLQKFSNTKFSLINVMVIDPAKKVPRREQQQCRKSKLSTHLKTKYNSRCCAARGKGELGIASDGRFVVGPNEMSNSRIALAITADKSGALTLFIEGVDQEVMDLCMHLIYSESFRIKKRLIPKFISVSRGLEILGSEGIYKELAMHIQDVPASIPLACEGPASAASDKQLLSSENKSGNSVGVKHSTREIEINQPVIDVQEGKMQGLVDIKKCLYDRGNTKSLKGKLPKCMNLLQSESKSVADEHAGSLNLSAKDELCMYMNHETSADKCLSGASDNGNVTMGFVAVDDSLIKEEDPLEIGKDNFTDHRELNGVDENQTLQNLPSGGQFESIYNAHIRSPDLHHNDFGKGSTSCQKKFCNFEKQALSEVEVKEEPVENLGTLSELRAFRFKSKRKYVENIEAVTNDWSSSDHSIQQVEELKNKFPGEFPEHVAVAKKCEKIFLESDTTRGELEEGDIENEQTNVEVGLLNNHSASDVELSNESQASSPLIKKMEAKEDSKITLSNKQKRNFASVVSEMTLLDSLDTQERWQQNDDNDNRKGIIPVECPDTRERLGQNKSAEAKISANDEHDLLVMKSEKDERIDLVCKEAMFSENTVLNDFDDCVLGGNDASHDQGQQLLSKEESSYIELNKETSNHVDILKPRTRSSDEIRLSHLSNKDKQTLVTECVTNDSRLDKFGSKINVLVIKGNVHDKIEYENAQDTSLSLCDDPLSKETFDMGGFLQESISFQCNSSNRFGVSQKSIVGISRVRIPDRDLHAHMEKLQNPTLSFNKPVTGSHLVFDDNGHKVANSCKKEGTVLEKKDIDMENSKCIRIHNPVEQSKKHNLIPSKTSNRKCIEESHLGILIDGKNSSQNVATANMSKCRENPSSFAHPSQETVTVDETKLYNMNLNSFKTSSTSVFKFQKTRRENEIAAYRRKILRSASSFHSKRGAKLPSSQRNSFKRGGKNITFQNRSTISKKVVRTLITQNSAFRKCQEPDENFTVMEGVEHSEHENGLLSEERLPIISGQVSGIPSVEHGASGSENCMATTQKISMHHEEKVTETLKLKTCHEAGLKSSESLKEVNLSSEQRSAVTLPGKKSNVCTMSQEGGPDYLYANIDTASATVTEESENHVGSRKLKTDNENYDDLITNASWGSLAEEVEYVVVKDLAVTSKEKMACITERSETLECTTESFTVIRNHSVLESIDDFGEDNFSVLKSGVVSGSPNRFNRIQSSKEDVKSDTNLKEPENGVYLENGKEMFPGTKQKQVPGCSDLQSSEFLEGGAETLKDTFTDNWSFVTNSESLESKISKDTDVAAEFTVQVGDVSIKIQEYSKVKDEVYSLESVCRNVPDKLQNNKSLFTSFRRENILTTEGTKQRSHNEEKISKPTDLQEEKIDMKYVFQCPCCQKILESEELLLNHVLESHKTYLCDYCPVPTCSVLLARNKFRIHLRQHLVTNRYQCSFCSFSASMRGAMSRHESTHTKPQVSQDFKIMKKGYSKYRKSSKKQFPREELQQCSLDGNIDGKVDHGTRTVKVTRRSSFEGDRKLSLRRSSRTGMSGCKKESVVCFEETIDALEDEEDGNKQDTLKTSLRAPGDLAVEYLETEMLKDSGLDITSTSSCGSSIEPTIEPDLEVEGSKTGNQEFKGLPINCCSTLLSTVCEVVDHIRQNHLSITKGPGPIQKGLGSGVPCIDSNCPVSLKTTNLAVHLKSHLVPRKIGCNLCTYRTNCEFALRTHTLAHNRIKSMKQKKRALGSRRCVLKQRLRLRKHSLPEEKTSVNDYSSKVTHRKLPAQGISSKATFQVPLPNSAGPNILKRKTKCSYLYQKKTKLTLQYLKLEREAKKLSDKVQKLDQDIKMVIQDPSQEEAEEVIPSHTSNKSALDSVTRSSLLRKKLLQNAGEEQDAGKNNLHLDFEMSKNDKRKRKNGSIEVSCKGRTVAKLENNHIKKKVKRQCSKSTKVKFESQLLSKVTGEGNENNVVFSEGDKADKTKLRSCINGEMHDTTADTSIKCGHEMDQAVEASNVCGSVIKPYFDYSGSNHSADNDVAVDLSVKGAHTSGFLNNVSLNIAAPDATSQISTNVYHQKFQEDVSGFSSLNSEGCLTGSANTELSQMAQRLSCMRFLGTETVDDLSSVRRSMQNAVKFNTHKSGTSSEELDETEENSTGLYQCPLCSEQYQDPNTLVDHYTLFHSKHLPYVCKFKGCPAVLSRQNSLKHLESHLYKRNFDCPFCSYSHKSLYLLKHHLMVHREVSETLEENQQVEIHVRGKSGTGLINLLCQETPKSNKRKRRGSGFFERNTEY